jgi:hypothetical protein
MQSLQDLFLWLSATNVADSHQKGILGEACLPRTPTARAVYSRSRTYRASGSSVAPPERLLCPAMV